MYKVLIVEDEKIERDHLVSMIEALTLPFEKILTATNGKEGLSVFEKEQPHIVIADINMPMMDGLQMIEAIKKQREATVCFILSSYDYFSYAQKALRIGVKDFILKPSDRETICALLTKALEEMRLRANRYEQEIKLIQKMHDFNEEIIKNCFYSIMTLQDKHKIQENLKLLGIEAISGVCIVFTHIDKKQLWEICDIVNDYGYFGICDMVDTQGVLFVFASYILGTKEINSLMETIASLYTEVHIFSGMIVKEDERLMDSYNQAKAKALQIGKTADTLYDEKRIEMIAKDFLAALEAEDKAMLISQLYPFASMIKADGFYDDMVRLLHTLAREVENKYNLYFDWKLFSKDIDCRIQDFASLEAFAMEIYDMLQKSIHSASYTQNVSSYKKALTYIEENYHKPITLVTVAEHLSITPFYLSRLINKHGKESFTEIVNFQRIKKAKQLIEEGYSFKEITYQVGFTSQSYFTKIFKKLVQMSPGEYKSRFEQDS